MVSIRQKYVQENVQKVQYIYNSIYGSLDFLECTARNCIYFSMENIITAWFLEYSGIYFCRYSYKNFYKNPLFTKFFINFLIHTYVYKNSQYIISNWTSTDYSINISINKSLYNFVYIFVHNSIEHLHDFLYKFLYKSIEHLHNFIYIFV